MHASIDKNTAAKSVEHFKPPRSDFSLVYKTERKLHSDWVTYDLAGRKVEKRSDLIPKCNGVPLTMSGTCVFRYIVLKDCGEDIAEEDGSDCYNAFHIYRMAKLNKED